MISKLLLLILVSYKNAINGQGTDNFVVEKIYPCQVIPHPKINLSCTPKTFSQPQVFDIAFNTLIPLGNQIKVSSEISLENKFLHNGWQRLFLIEDDFCRVVQLYVGPIAHDIETAMGIPKGVCPIPKGNYHAVNFTADFGRLKIQSFPLGRLRATVKLFEKPDKLLVCSHSIVSNMH